MTAIKKIECFHCARSIFSGSIVYRFRTPAGKLEDNVYCLRACAEADHWGPRFQDCKIVERKLKKD